MLNTPFAPWPSFSSEEVQAVAEVLASNRVNYWTGDRGRTFEERYAAWVGVPHAVALTNGTVALELALRALGIGPGDEVVVTPRTFLASASCIVAVGATPVFADIDAETQGLSAETIEPVLTPRTRAIICVHLGGRPCDMDPIMALARRRGLKVIEDCAQAHGARYKGRSVGSIGDIGAWSFCQDKIMTTGGEGGMVTTNDPDLFAFMWSWKDHGKTWRPYLDEAPGARLPWQFGMFGSNGRMIEMQAAIGLIQLDRMAEWTARRTELAMRLADVCARHDVVRVPLAPPDVVHAWYRFYAFVRPERLASGWTRERIIEEISAREVPCFHGSASEIYLERAFDGTPSRPAERLPIAKALGETSLALLVHPTITDAQIDRACAVLHEVLGQAGG
ncbi:aminotransferase [Brevundimonas sp. AAP58]|uniref:DegT/DnrJ/EryC1/StrS family aminotransferase n=1 Tax=Brevundimonas sp. AAP58 TaxID=1523422 RepID=UPI0006B8BA77|nr:DegT/DnrJ/EryC1/StrS aminotransferase family protein [Brevundimonas sp. AAP58]KPF83518.1 aminotransferase [Brevundimonas sp. AAP58]